MGCWACSRVAAWKHLGSRKPVEANPSLIRLLSCLIPSSSAPGSSVAGAAVASALKLQTSLNLLKIESAHGLWPLNGAIVNPGIRLRLGPMKSLFVLLAALVGERAEPAKEPPVTSNFEWVHSLVAQIEEGLQHQVQVGSGFDSWVIDTMEDLQKSFLCASAQVPHGSFLGPAVRLQLFNLLTEHAPRSKSTERLEL